MTLSIRLSHSYKDGSHTSRRLVCAYERQGICAADPVLDLPLALALCVHSPLGYPHVTRLRSSFLQAATRALFRFRVAGVNVGDLLFYPSRKLPWGTSALSGTRLRHHRTNSLNMPSHSLLPPRDWAGSSRCPATGITGLHAHLIGGTGTDRTDLAP